MEDQSGATTEEDVQFSQDMVRIVGYDEPVLEYANDVYIAVEDAGLQLVFTRFLFPPIISTSDQERVRQQGYLANQVVAKILVPPPLAERLIQGLPERLATYRRSTGLEDRGSHYVGEPESEIGQHERDDGDDA